MLIDSFTRDEQSHDFAGTLEDSVDPEIPEHSLDRYRFLSPCCERVGGFISSPTTHLEGIVRKNPASLGIPEFGHGCFEAKIISASVCHRLREISNG